MASISGSSVVSYDYLLRNCYSSNRLARIAASRASYGSAELLSADSDALRKLTRNLQDISYDKDNGQNIYNNAKAFVETYNNAVESADKLTSSDLERNVKKMKQFVKENQEALSSVGISISSGGKLQLDKEKMLKTSSSKMEKVFSGAGGFANKIGKFAKTINGIAKKLAQEEVAKKQKADELSTLPVQTNSAGPNSIDFRA